MKRVLSIFLLGIMSLVAIQPTLAFHYCGKSLRSVSLTSKASQATCCGQKSCCSDYTVKMATDNFQSPQQEATTGTPSLVSPVLFLICDDLFRRSEFHAPLIFQNIFPPGGLAKYSVDLLSWICIFRI